MFVSLENSVITLTIETFGANDDQTRNCSLNRVLLISLIDKSQLILIISENKIITEITKTKTRYIIFVKTYHRYAKHVSVFRDSQDKL